MNIIITGAKGMLGTDISSRLLQEQNVILTTRNELDITNLNAVMEYFRKNKTDVIINCAAYTDVDRCETDRDYAFLVNAIGPRNLAIASNEINAALVHISTDYIFDGTKNSPYSEQDLPNPLNVYGQTKLSGENFIKTIANKYYIIRTQWLYGMNGKNFVKTMMKSAKEKSTISVVNDQFGSPTYTVDLADAINEIIKSPAYGIYHITNSGILSWYEFTREIFKQAKINNIIVSPCSSKEYPRPARRPAYGALDNYMWRIQGYKPLRSYKEALADYLKKIMEK